MAAVGQNLNFPNFPNLSLNSFLSYVQSHCLKFRLISRIETPSDTPIPSGMNTPRFDFDSAHLGPGSTSNGLRGEKNRMQPIKISALEYESDIDADELLPVYIESKAKLFQLQSTLSPSKGVSSNQNGKKHTKKSGILISMSDPVSTKLLRKIQKIEDDVLFDRYIAEKQWEIRRIQLEKEAADAVRRNGAEIASTTSQDLDTEITLDSDDEISREAAKIGAALLEENESDDDAALANLFASLPVNEVDPITGKSSTVTTGSNGVKITIRDFGKWTGVNPTRVLEEACRARLVPYTGTLRLISDIS